MSIYRDGGEHYLLWVWSLTTFKINFMDYLKLININHNQSLIIILNTCS